MEKKKLCATIGAEMDRHRTICRGCSLKAVEKDSEAWRIRHNASAKRWNAAHPERVREMARDAQRRYRAEDPQKHRAQQKSHRQKVRFEIMELLGGAFCVHCGFSDARALQIAHVFGDGLHDRIKAADLWKRREDMKADPLTARQLYQVLCANGHWMKRVEQGEVGKRYRKKE